MLCQTKCKMFAYESSVTFYLCRCLSCHNTEKMRQIEWKCATTTILNARFSPLSLSRRLFTILILIFFLQMCVWMSNFCRFSWEADLLEKLKYASHEHTSASPAQLFIFAVLLRCRFRVHKKKAKYTTLFASDFHILICTLCSDMVGF